MLAIYATAFERAEAAVRAGEEPGAIFAAEFEGARPPLNEAMAVQLAATDAKRGRPRREDADVCRAVFTFCDCAAPLHTR